MAWTTLKTWNTSDILTAGDLNTYVRDNGNAIGKLTAYTPTWTASTTNPTIGNGTIIGRYFAVEEWCWISVQVVSGTTTTGGSGIYNVSLPFTACSLAGTGGAEQNIPVTLCQLATARYWATAVIGSSASTMIINHATNWWMFNSPFTFAGTTGNYMSVSGIYRRV